MITVFSMQGKYVRSSISYLH